MPAFVSLVFHFKADHRNFPYENEIGRKNVRLTQLALFCLASARLMKIFKTIARLLLVFLSANKHFSGRGSKFYQQIYKKILLKEREFGSHVVKKLSGK